jgi:hypothetical protein
MNTGKFGAQIVYFSEEGRQNLDEALKILRKVLKKREELRGCKIVIFTAHGEGPYKAFSKLSEFAPHIIAVTFPRTFSIQRAGVMHHPTIPPKIRQFFDGVGIDVVVPPSLPFDLIEGLEGHNQQAMLVRDLLSIFGGGFSLCIQAVLRACDAGNVEVGESVIAVSGDVAALITASTTKHFLNREFGVSVQEIFCKPRKLTIVRPSQAAAKLVEGEGAETTGTLEAQPRATNSSKQEI